jgi:hypothetical protein
MDLLSGLNSLRELLSSARNRQAELQARILELQAQRRSLVAAPLNRADTEATILAALTAQCARALSDPGLLRDISDARNAGPELLDRDNALPGLTPVYPVVAYAASADLLDRLTALLATPGEILSRLKPAFDNLDWTQSGKPLSERRKAVVVLDKEIAGLQGELSSLQASLATTEAEAPPAATGPQLGERRLIDGTWARYGAIYPGQPPGWIYEVQ